MEDRSRGSLALYDGDAVALRQSLSAAHWEQLNTKTESDRPGIVQH